jgi:prepilin-type N-terminal cleavage/methylation domain-containing protein
MKCMLRSKQGFTLVEMILVMLLFVIVIGITGDAFNRIVTKALSISKSAESNISGIVGLEMMRVDLESAGYGVPWSFASSVTYQEATALPGSVLNDNGRVYATDTSQNNIPRAVASSDNYSSADQTVVFNGTDPLAIRSQSIATNAAAKRWTYIESAVLPSVNPSPAPYSWTADNLVAADRVVMIKPIVNLKPANQLVVNSSTLWSATFNNYSTIGKPPTYQDAEKKSDAYIIYGVDSNSNLRMPFNRADYYVRMPAASEQNWIKSPTRCNPSAGFLFKSVVGHTSGSYQELPVLECVLDMQVVYGLRTSGSATITDSSNISALTPQEVREQVKEIKVYILTHDGGIDRTYQYPNATIGVGPGNGITSGTGNTYNFATMGVPNWRNYHWKVYQVVARPNNLAGNVAQ